MTVFLPSVELIEREQEHCKREVARRWRVLAKDPARRGYQLECRTCGHVADWDPVLDSNPAVLLTCPRCLERCEQLAAWRRHFGPLAELAEQAPIIPGSRS